MSIDDFYTLLKNRGLGEPEFANFRSEGWFLVSWLVACRVLDIFFLFSPFFSRLALFRLLRIPHHKGPGDHQGTRPDILQFLEPQNPPIDASEPN